MNRSKTLNTSWKKKEFANFDYRLRIRPIGVHFNTVIKIKVS
jgi:hypothetical protein